MGLCGSVLLQFPAIHLVLVTRVVAPYVEDLAFARIKGKLPLFRPIPQIVKILLQFYVATLVPQVHASKDLGVICKEFAHAFHRLWHIVDENDEENGS